MPMYQRPPFWRVPHQRCDPDEEPVRDFGQRRKVTPGTPAGKDLIRGDIIAKVDDYDARDLRHEDAQNLFKNASNQIKLVVQRGGSSSHLYSLPRASGSFVGRVPTPTFYHEYAEDADRMEGARTSTPMAPRSPIPNSAAAPYRNQSPLPPPAWSGGKGPESLPRTPVPPQYSPFPHQYESEYRILLLSPNSMRTDESLDESIASQPYRTTPLVLPGAKVRREPGPTESYLRHHPNPAMRAPPHHDYRDTLMKQKVAESVLHRVVGDEGAPKVVTVRDRAKRFTHARQTSKTKPIDFLLGMVHKQFNSPIGLYSDQNIANSIRQQTSPLPHKPTLQYDPAKSETFRALQEEGLGDVVQEVPVPVETKVFTAPPTKRQAPTPKPAKTPDAKPKGKQTTFVNSLHEEHIQQSNSFKRLMFHVLGDTEF